MDSLCLDSHGVDNTPVIRGEHLDHTHSIHWDVRTSTVASDTWGGWERVIINTEVHTQMLRKSHSPNIFLYS